MQAQKVNYQKELDRVLDKLREEGRVPRLLLHSCCAPCSSYVLEYLSEYFEITVFYYNPNIYPESEYHKRVEEQKMLIGKMKAAHPVSFMEGVYEKERFYQMAVGLEKVKEGGERCFRCYALRLGEAAQKAREGGFDYFTTTLSISPLKMPRSSMRSAWRLAGRRGLRILRQILKRKTAISVPWNCPANTGCTARITAVVSFHWKIAR